MGIIIKIPTQIKKRSNSRPKSLILNIPAAIRDAMVLEHNTPIDIEVHKDDQEKYIKIKKRRT